MTTRTTAVTPYLEEYLGSTMHELPEFLIEIFNSGDIFGKKDMQISLLQAHFLRMLTRLTNAKKILEVGTYVGFSAANFACATPQVLEVVTCEIVSEHYDVARKNFLKTGLSEKITPILGDAKDTINRINSKFDILFLDGDKENYDMYLPLALRVLPPGGIFVVDNTLFKGELIGGNSGYSKGIKRLMDMISHHPDFDLSHITLGDGMLIAQRR